MFHTIGLETAKDLRDKLRRDSVLLDKEVTSDALFNFVVTGYSLIDWIKHDSNVPSHARSSEEITNLYEDKWLKVCGDLATSAKHFKITKRKPVIDATKSREGWGMGRYGKVGYGVGEVSIMVMLSDGSEFSALELMNGVLASWDVFFSKHEI